MKNLKKFNELPNKNLKKFNEGKYDKAHSFANKLKNGFAISVSKENIEDFFNILRDILWIEVPEYTEHYSNERYYFVLFGNRLLHSDKPYFGGNKLEVYVPSF